MGGKGHSPKRCAVACLLRTTIRKYKVGCVGVPPQEQWSPSGGLRRASRNPRCCFHRTDDGSIGEASAREGKMRSTAAWPRRSSRRICYINRAVAGERMRDSIFPVSLVRVLGAYP